VGLNIRLGVKSTNFFSVAETFFYFAISRPDDFEPAPHPSAVAVTMVFPLCSRSTVCTDRIQPPNRALLLPFCCRKSHDVPLNVPIILQPTPVRAFAFAFFIRFPGAALYLASPGSLFLTPREGFFSFGEDC